MSAHRVHRRVRPARSAIAGRVALSGAAVLTLGAGPLVGLASAAPDTGDTASTTAGTTVAATAPVGAVATVDGPNDADGGSEALWYGLLTTAAVAGAAGAHQLVGGRHRRRV
ncbi:hypothetical protein [Actinomycetospora sp.]|uniref:hypothetical protein n=1 Tax=Actinomycetospora sp. TaxID=1872135 RepID=UPI002F40AC0C